MMRRCNGFSLLLPPARLPVPPRPVSLPAPVSRFPVAGVTAYDHLLPSSTTPPPRDTYHDEGRFFQGRSLFQSAVDTSIDNSCLD